MLIPKTPKEPTLNDIQLTWLLLNVELMRLDMVNFQVAESAVGCRDSPIDVGPRRLFYIAALRRAGAV